MAQTLLVVDDDAKVREGVQNVLRWDLKVVNWLFSYGKEGCPGHKLAAR